MSSNLKRGGDADAASPATKRASLAPDLSPPPTDIKQFEMPVFNIKRFIPSKWRDMIPSGDDLEVEGFSFSTEDPHMLRVFEFAVRAHQAVKCSGSGAAGRKGVVSLCAFCSAAGPGFSFEVDPSKSKIIPLSLYAEVMKTYVPCAQDFIASFPEEADLAIGDSKLTRLDETDYFFDGLFPMWYCSKRYPDLPKAVEEMDTLQRYKPEYDETRALDSAYNQDRRIAVAELKKFQATQKAEFCQLLKQISISSRLDLALHKLSVIRPPDKPTGAPVSSASQDTASQFFEKLTKYFCNKSSNGNTQFIEDLTACLRKDAVFHCSKPSLLQLGAGGAGICQHGAWKNRYMVLDEYSVAEGCDAEEVMRQTTCTEKGDHLYRHVSKLGDDAMEPILCSPPPICSTFSSPVYIPLLPSQSDG